ncbi:MAG: hypothetical protein OER43_20090 [Gammaproteobacteria bacterium]|nr:hypothetical protein [Gammaproteobacteria bacterium]
MNEGKQHGYRGACPPVVRHRKFQRRCAPDKNLDGLKHPAKAQVEVAMEGHRVAVRERMGAYEKE